jgi:ADP-ribose pyrophosphatase YjhB (NUDIX family)
MATKTYRAAGGVVVQQGVIAGLDPDQRYILLLDRPGRNEVRLPKGHIDPGESVEATALRETTEESGYADLEVIADLGEQIVTYDYEGNHYIRHEHYFLMVLRSQQQLPRNKTDAQQFQVRWTPGEDAVEKLTYEAEKQWVQKALLLLPVVL